MILKSVVSMEAENSNVLKFLCNTDEGYKVVECVIDLSNIEIEHSKETMFKNGVSIDIKECQHIKLPILKNKDSIFILRDWK